MWKWCLFASTTCFHFQENLKIAFTSASVSTSAFASMLPDNWNKIIFEVKHYGLKILDQIQQSWFSKQPSKSNSKISFWNNLKKINSISLDKASKYLHGSRSRSCFQENLMSASASASASTSASTSMLSDKFNKIINEEKHNVLNFFDWIRQLWFSKQPSKSN